MASCGVVCENGTAVNIIGQVLYPALSTRPRGAVEGLEAGAAHRPNRRCSPADQTGPRVPATRPPTHPRTDWQVAEAQPPLVARLQGQLAQGLAPAPGTELRNLVWGV